ncbi:MAG: aminodeoxychorismate lyase [Bacilli bacterium]
MIVFCDGHFLDETELRISPFDHGFLYGLGAFETLRTYDGKLWRWDMHMERLDTALQMLHIRPKYNSNQLQQIIQELENRNGLQNSYIRLNVSAGVAPIGLKTSEYDNPTYIIFIKPLPKMLHEKKLEVVKTPRNTPEGSFRIKSHHYLNSWLGKQELGDSVDKEGLMLTEDGFVAETIVGNVFWRKGERIYTPSLALGILAGTMRKWVINTLQKSPYACVEGRFTLAHLYDADEVWMTNAVQGIVRVASLQTEEKCTHYEQYMLTEWLLEAHKDCVRGERDE